MSASYAQTQDFLYNLKTREIDYRTDRMQPWLEALGHPEQQIPLIHIAGTNGKGSTAAMIEAIFRAAGWKTGLYTSPHLVRLGERIQMNRQLLSEQEIIDYVVELQSVADTIARTHGSEHPSFFEYMTILAFLHFAREKCDIGLIEVGLGGRLDATNVITPEVSVITSIGLDHCEILGNTIEQIAREKAGIIKPGVPVVIGKLPLAAEQVVWSIAKSRKAPVYSIVEAYGPDLTGAPTPILEGAYQRWNAATAALVAKVMPPMWKLTDDAVTEGLATVSWPGRWQRLRVGGRLVVLDASHNEEGAQVLRANLERMITETGRPPIVVTGVLGVERAKPLLKVLCELVSAINLVMPQQNRASSFEDLESVIPAAYNGQLRRSTVNEVFPSPSICTLGSADDWILVTGSIYLAGEVLARVEPERGENEARLQDF